MSVTGRDGLDHLSIFRKILRAATRMLNLGCEQLVPASPSTF